MHCKKYGSDWNTSRSVLVCPFCGRNLDEGRKDHDIRSAFVQILESRGIEILAESARFISLLADYAPQYAKERNLIKNALSVGVAKTFLDANGKTDAERQRAVLIVRRDLKDKLYIDDNGADLIVACFTSALRWKTTDATDISGAGPPPTKPNNTVPKHMTENAAYPPYTPDEEWYEALKRYEKEPILCRNNSLHQYDYKNGGNCPYCEAYRRFQGDSTDLTPVSAINRVMASPESIRQEQKMKESSRTNPIKTFFRLNNTTKQPFQSDSTGNVVEFFPDIVQIRFERQDIKAAKIVCSDLSPNNRAVLKGLAEFVKIYQSNKNRRENKNENVWIQVDFHYLQCGESNDSFSCKKTTRIVLNPFIAPKITALKGIPNRPLQTFLDFHGGKSYDQKPQTNFTKGSLFHEKVQNNIAGTGKSNADVNREFIESEPWSAISSDYSAFAGSGYFCKEFLAQPLVGDYRQSFQNSRMGIEVDFLNDHRGLMGKEDFVQERHDEKRIERIIDLKSGNLYQPDRQQVYFYLDADETSATGSSPQGRIHYHDKWKGFCDQSLSVSDKDATDQYGNTIRGFADCGFYRNNWVLQFLYVAFIPELYVKTGDVDYVDLSPSKPTASCEKWTQETCEKIIPKFEVLALSPCSRFCKGAAARRTFHIPIATDVRHLYFKWMVSMVHKQAMLEYLEFQYFCNRPLKNLKESCRIVFNAKFDNLRDGIVTFHVPKDCDHSDFHIGTGIIVVPYEVAYLKNDQIGKPIREADGKIRFLRGTVIGIELSNDDGKIFKVSVKNPFPERFLKRYKTFSFQESSFDSSSTESQALFQVLLTDSQERLRKLLLGKTKFTGSKDFDSSIKTMFDVIDKIANQGKFGGETIDRNKIEIVKEALAADTLYMIQGPPGTGKTYSIVLIALYYLIFTNKNVKIATFTNNAAKHILKELSKNASLADGIIRDGNGIHGKDYAPFHDGAIKWAGRHDTEIDQEYQLDAAKLTSAIEQGERAYKEKCRDLKNKIRILVGTTHSLFTNSVAMYDWQAEDTITIIDEASQLTEPKTLLGLANSEKYILVGDEKQLSPVVPDREEIPLFPCDKDASEDEAEKNSTTLDTRLPKDAFWEPLRNIELKNFNESLFERFLRLYANVPGHHGLLTMIYRGPIELYEFSNREYYDNKLKSKKELTGHVSQLDDATADSGQRVIFHHVPLQSSTSRSSNHHAWYIRDEILSRIKQADLKNVSIVTLFNAQVHELRQVMPDMDIRTVDRMQGHEKDIVIFDIACSPELLQNAKGLAILGEKLVAKKLNVAMTRAKEKLIIVADRTALDTDKDRYEDKTLAPGSFKKLLMFLDEVIYHPLRERSIFRRFLRIWNRKS